MTKRLIIWFFWYMLLSLIFAGVWRNDDGSIQIPSWWGAGGLVILLGWWGRFLAVKYPSNQKPTYAITAVACVVIAVAAFVS